MADDDGIFLRNSWYVAAWNHELIDGKKLARTILEKPIVLYRGASGRVVALDDRCCHRAAPLSMGRVEGDDIRCMYHGMKFAADGKCIQIPGQDIIPAKLGVRSYPVVEKYNLIFIWTGDPEKADPKLVLDYPPLADPKWRGLPGYMHYKANWLLIAPPRKHKSGMLADWIWDWPGAAIATSTRADLFTLTAGTRWRHGPVFTFNEAISLQIYCKDQKELDYYWEKLTAGGDPKSQQCGWLKDKYGVSWQVVPAAIADMMSDPKDPGAQRAMEALLEMKKIDIAALERAYRGEGVKAGAGAGR